MIAGVLAVSASCQDYLDVNTNPNAPETVASNLYLSPMLHWMASGQQWDGRCTAQFTQMLTQTTRSTNSLMGRNFSAADPCAEQWRDVYWQFGQNLVDMMNIAQAQKRWDILGVGYVLKAWGWQTLADLNGEIIVKEAFDQSRLTFDYDSQQFAYEETRRLLDSAIVYLNKTGDAVDATYMARGDKMYNGDRTKWLKFAHALYAINLSHYTNKKDLYKPADVIAQVDQAFSSNADDALWTYPGTANDDRNFMGPTRSNFGTYRQTQFMVGLMDGSMFGVRDPRISRMLVPSPDSQYHGLDVNSTLASMPVDQQPENPYGYVGSVAPTGAPGVFTFADKAKQAVITYAQLQFVKAEAAYYAGNKPMALAAYKNGIAAHIDFVNERNREDNQHVTQITAAEKAAFLADPRIVPTDPNALTLSMIMSQKFIAEFAWAFNEQWMDMRRYHYTDNDPVTGQHVFLGFELPLTLASENAGKPIYRLLPRYNSEYVWNQAALDVIGGLALDYHTKPLWIVTP